MILTTKGRYAVMAILDLAVSSFKKPSTLAHIAERQKIDQNYLEQIFINLKKANIVKSIKGPGGGYQLKYAIDKLNIAMIIDASTENIKMTRCEDKSHNSCLGSSIKCNSHFLWEGLSNHIRSYFENITVLDIMNKINHLENSGNILQSIVIAP